MLKYGWICYLFLLPFVTTQYSSRLNMEKYKRSIVNQHNEFRRLQMSSNMKELTWNNDLAIDAMNWARGCHFGHSNGRNGENLYYMESPKMTEQQFLQQALDSWFIEGLFWTRSTNCGKSCAYTQMVWAWTNNVGCAVRKCKLLTQTVPEDGIMNAWFLVCHYSPKGNDYVNYPFKHGDACSQCDPWEFCRNKLCTEDRLASPRRSFSNMDMTAPISHDQRTETTQQSTPDLQNEVLGMLKEFMSFTMNKTKEKNKFSLNSETIQNWRRNKGNSWRRNDSEGNQWQERPNRTLSNGSQKSSRFSWKDDTGKREFKFRIFQPYTTASTTVPTTTLRTMNAEGEPIERSMASAEVTVTTASTTTTPRAPNKTTIPVSPSQQMAEAGCVDSDVNCPNWKVYCVDNVFVFENCRRTCNSCHVPRPPPASPSVNQVRIRPVLKSTQEKLHRKHHHHHEHHLHHHGNEVSSVQPNGPVHHSHIQDAKPSSKTNINSGHHHGDKAVSLQPVQGHHHGHHHKQTKAYSQPSNDHNHRNNALASAQRAHDHHHGNSMIANPMKYKSIPMKNNQHHGHSMASTHAIGDLRLMNSKSDSFAQPKLDRHHQHKNNMAIGSEKNTNSGVWKTLDTSSLHVNKMQLSQSIRASTPPPDHVQHFHAQAHQNQVTYANTHPPTISPNVMINVNNYSNGQRRKNKHLEPEITTVSNVCEDMDARCTSWAYLCSVDWSVKTVCPKSCGICHLNLV